MDGFSPASNKATAVLSAAASDLKANMPVQRFCGFGMSFSVAEVITPKVALGADQQIPEVQS